MTTWFNVIEQKPKCSKKPYSFGVEVLISPRIDGLATAFYGRRQTDAPNFYRHGAVLHGVEYWAPLPELPSSEGSV